MDLKPEGLEVGVVTTQVECLIAATVTARSVNDCLMHALLDLPDYRPAN